MRAVIPPTTSIKFPIPAFAGPLTLGAFVHGVCRNATQRAQSSLQLRNLIRLQEGAVDHRHADYAGVSLLAQRFNRRLAPNRPNRSCCVERPRPSRKRQTTPFLVLLEPGRPNVQNLIDERRTSRASGARPRSLRQIVTSSPASSSVDQETRPHSRFSDALFEGVMMLTDGLLVDELSQVISQATGPAFLLGAVAAFVSELNTRLNRVADRRSALLAAGYLEAHLASRVAQSCSAGR
jgi:hypothetical protein